MFFQILGIVFQIPVVWVTIAVIAIIWVIEMNVEDRRKAFHVRRRR